MSIAETELDVVCERLFSLFLLVNQRGAIVGKIQSMVGKLCRLLQLFDSQAFANQLCLLLLLSVVVEVDGATGHCIAPHAFRINSMLALLLVEVTTAWVL